MLTEVVVVILTVNLVMRVVTVRMVMAMGWKMVVVMTVNVRMDVVMRMVVTSGVIMVMVVILMMVNVMMTVNMEHPLWRRVQRFFQTLKIDQVSLLRDIYAEETLTQKDTCTPLFTEALFTTARTWRPPMGPSADDG